MVALLVMEILQQAHRYNLQKTKTSPEFFAAQVWQKKVVIMLEKRVLFGIALKQRENITDRQLSPAESMLQKCTCAI